MKDALLIFANGMVGVFAGMAILYISIRTTSFVLDKLEGKKEQS